MAKEKNQVKPCNYFVEATEMSMCSCLVTNVQLNNAGEVGLTSFSSERKIE